MRPLPRASSAPAATGEGPWFDPAVRCGSCGSFGALDLGDRQLCEECYRAPGSCCPEFGKDDLWSTDE